MQKKSVAPRVIVWYNHNIETAELGGYGGRKRGRKAVPVKIEVLFGRFVEVPFGDLGEMLKKTETLLADGTPVIAEASFSYEGLFCSVDILKNHGDGCFVR